MRQSIVFKTLAILAVVIIVSFFGAGYLFYQNDTQLIDKIREYNLGSAMSALDDRKDAELEMNRQRIQESAGMIAKNSATFLFNFDTAGLKNSLSYDIRQEHIKAIKVWDSSMNDLFLLAYKKEERVVFDRKLPENFNEYLTFKAPVLQAGSEKSSKIGEIVLYYDDSIVIDKINRLKNETKRKIELFDAQIDRDLFESAVMKLYIGLGLLITISAVIGFLFIKFVNTPLLKLKDGLDGFFLFLQNKKDYTEKIELDSQDEFGQMARSLNENIAVSARLHEEINDLNTNLEKKVEEKTQKVTTLLDNAGQGFLSLKEDLTVDDEYSKECLKFFEGEIAGKKIEELLFADSADKKEFFAETLKSLMNEKERLKIDTILSLLQKEFILNKKAARVEYKLLENSRFMLILTDITANKLLERSVDKERKVLKMVVAAVSNTGEFFELIEDYRRFIKNRNQLIDKEKTPLHNATVLYRTIHTFKGLFAQKEMINTVKGLHLVESGLSDFLHYQEGKTDKDLQAVIASAGFTQWLDKDIEIIKRVLGEEFFDSKEELKISKSSLKQLEDVIYDYIKRGLENEQCMLVLHKIERLKQKPVLGYLSSYVKLTEQLADKLDKSLYPLNLIGDKNILSKKEYGDFFKSLVHVFRNAVDHGIESMDERAEQGKDPMGTISCSVNEDAKGIHITIADDGRGVDLEAVREKAEKVGIPSVMDMSKEEIVSLIFNSEFSVKEEVTELSGRGVGLPAVKAELERIGGSLDVHTEEHKGTSFHFLIPNDEES